MPQVASGGERAGQAPPLQEKTSERPASALRFRQGKRRALQGKGEDAGLPGKNRRDAKTAKAAALRLNLRWRRPDMVGINAVAAIKQEKRRASVLLVPAG